MKTLHVLLLFLLLPFFVKAQAEVSKAKAGTYCVEVRDGVRVVTHDGEIMTMEVALSDSTRITPNGTLIRTDGARAVLKEGECVGSDGHRAAKASGEKPK